MYLGPMVQRPSSPRAFHTAMFQGITNAIGGQCSRRTGLTRPQEKPKTNNHPPIDTPEKPRQKQTHQKTRQFQSLPTRTWFNPRRGEPEVSLRPLGFLTSDSDPEPGKPQS